MLTHLTLTVETRNYCKKEKKHYIKFLLYIKKKIPSMSMLVSICRGKRLSKCYFLCRFENTPFLASQKHPILLEVGIYELANYNRSVFMSVIQGVKHKDSLSKLLLIAPKET